MNISELINILNIIKEKYGNQKVYVPYRGEECAYILSTTACMDQDFEVYDKNHNLSTENGLIIF